MSSLAALPLRIERKGLASARVHNCTLGVSSIKKLYSGLNLTWNTTVFRSMTHNRCSHGTIYTVVFQVKCNPLYQSMSNLRVIIIVIAQYGGNLCVCLCLLSRTQSWRGAQPLGLEVWPNQTPPTSRQACTGHFSTWLVTHCKHEHSTRGQNDLLPSQPIPLATPSWPSLVPPGVQRALLLPVLRERWYVRLMYSW